MSTEQTADNKPVSFVSKAAKEATTPRKPSEDAPISPAERDAIMENFMKGVKAYIRNIDIYSL